MTEVELICPNCQYETTFEYEGPEPLGWPKCPNCVTSTTWARLVKKEQP